MTQRGSRCLGYRCDTGGRLSVQVSALKELSSDHLPTLVHVATQHATRRDVRKAVEWGRYDLGLSRRLPEVGLSETVRQFDKAVAAFDEAVVSAVDASSRMNPGLTSHYQRIPKETSVLARERNHLRRRWQRTRGPADKAEYNRATGILRR